MPTTITNTGNIIVTAATGEVRAVDSEGGDFIYSNYGQISAHADTGTAFGMWVRYGWAIENQVGGEISAEGMEAIAVYFRNDQEGSITNAGLIEATSLDPNVASVALLLGHMSHIPMQITNSGTIRADYAIYDDNDSASTTTQLGVENVFNQSTGLIEGIIALNRGNDRIENDGIIRGDVILGEGNDVFDTVDGTFEGIADLGWGNDQFLGSAGADRVAGDNGNDTISGNGGNDLLLGGDNDDTLIGGAGNDGLFGEYGNDRIVTSGGDYADGGEGDDRIELGDYTFGYVSGGAGFDTLVLPGPAGVRTINLASALGEGAFAEFEQVELTGGKTLIIQASDITALTGGETTLHLATTLTDRVKLVGAWTRQADQTIDGVVWRA